MEHSERTYQSVVDDLTGREHVIYVAGVAMLFFIQFQAIPIQLPVQNVPVTSIIALFVLPFCIQRIPRSQMFSVVAAFMIFSIVHSGIGLIVDLLTGSGLPRFIAWIRQGFALFLGFAAYVVLRHAFRYIGNRDIMRIIVIGAIPAIIIALVNIVWGATGLGWAKAFVMNARFIACGFCYMSPFRAAGLATEPASFATILAIFVFPAALYFLHVRGWTFKTGMFLAGSLLSFLWTFSTTGVGILLGTLFGGMVLGPFKRMMRRSAVAFVIIGAAFLMLFPKNQIFRHATAILKGRENISFTDRFYSFAGPFILSLESASMFGYGLGFAVTHFEEVIPDDVQAGILAVKYKDNPSIAIITGRVYAETGFIGLLIWIGIFFVAVWKLQRLIKYARDGDEEVFFKLVRLGLLSLGISMFATIGPYHLPLIWVWLALIDARYIAAVERNAFQQSASKTLNGS
ncbi:MAG: hypothetical protein CL946_08635 [Ectothiorhodospiraceae bacterium]|nr:hypothetical protein [Ectothiorhodospiraceae bacterium]